MFKHGEASMSTRTENYLEAVEHLPEDALLVLHNVSWSEYEELLEDLLSWPGMRVAYNKGRLEVMSPSPKHERIKVFIDHLVAAFCDDRGIEMEDLGSTTYKRKRDEQGAEPDVCFYVTNLEHIIGKDKINPDSDPLPDVVVEIDISNESAHKFEIYASFGVPEIWRYEGTRMHLFQLSGKQYIEISDSRCFPGLSASVLTDFIEESTTKGRTAALRDFRQWLRTKTV